MNSTAESYDELPYPALVFPQTHPNRISAIAALLGISTKIPEHSRVLELGCGSGSNLIAMAVELPKATLVGVDFSKRQIDAGQEIIRECEIGNVTLHHADITSIVSDLGQFDYIIAHGLYSWVPADVQKKILDICRIHLAPGGIAYVSYNCYPGWHMRDIVRNMMTFRTSKTEGALPRVQQARELLEFIAANAAQGSTYATLLQGEAALLKTYQDGHLFHEYLESHNNPVYFHQFMENATKAGLQYMGDANPQMMSDGTLSPEARETLSRLCNNDILQTEQYLDFLRNRSFRATLLVHQEISLQREFNLQSLDTLYIAAPVASVLEDFDPNTAETVGFSLPGGNHFSVSNPLVKALLKTLAKHWPMSISFSNLMKQVGELLHGSSPAETRDALERYLLAGFLHGTIELSVQPWRCKAINGENPTVSALVRHQAKNNLPIVDLRHQIIQDTPGLRLVIPYLDGQHSVEQMIEALYQRAISGELQLSRNGSSVRSPEELKQLISEDVPRYLQQIEALSLLV